MLDFEKGHCLDGEKKDWMGKGKNFKISYYLRNSKKRSPCSVRNKYQGKRVSLLKTNRRAGSERTGKKKEEEFKKKEDGEIARNKNGEDS